MSGGISGDGAMDVENLRHMSGTDPVITRRKLATIIARQHGVNTKRDPVTDLRVQWAAKEFRELAAMLGLGGAP